MALLVILGVKDGGEHGDDLLHDLAGRHLRRKRRKRRRKRRRKKKRTFRAWTSLPMA